MDIVTEGLVTKVVNYGDSDRILTLLTADMGKISASAKGVRKAGAKLKFAAQPFCFGQYTLASRGSRYTVTGCTLRESFFELTEDMERMYSASAVCALSNLLEGEGAEILTETLRALAAICSEDSAEAAVRYLLFVSDASGYPVSANRCPVCGKALSGEEKVRFDMETGSFCCYECSAGVGVRGSTFSLVAAAKEGKSADADKETKKRALKLFEQYLLRRLDLSCRQLEDYIEMI